MELPIILAENGETILFNFDKDKNQDLRGLDLKIFIQNNNKIEI